MVNKVLISSQFIQGVKELRKKHKQKELEKLQTVINDLENQKVTKKYDNHGVGGKNKLSDIHISNDLVLLYRYETDLDEDMLIISLRLNSLVDHKTLNQEINKLHTIKVATKSPYKIEKQIKEDISLLYTQYTIEYDDGLIDGLERNEAVAKAKEIIDSDNTTYLYVTKQSRYLKDGHYDDVYDDVVDAYLIDGEWDVLLDRLHIFKDGVNFVK